ncbi:MULTISPECIES: SAF domain-containing protein [Paenibacillus]|uniref:Flagellar biosynthesis protein FlgA n=1 Tax=Paenibacillus campinasensis TaxID=66347 RepID=A0A268F1V3_9BACL|nr:MULTISPECIES: SAF domain-containing protein [Paenibacillus]PAD79352.1 flagellar biosynthesis protein FlgA [Paenibacillus campinasensis]PAK51705.1 flagellar biosynthesis protein FlgA [Paenibacillus sp. 7541]
MPIIKSRSRKLMYAGLAGAGIVGLICSGVILYIHLGHKEQLSMQQQRYDERIAQVEEERIRELKAMKSAWVPIRDIPSGSFIREQDIKEVKLPAEAAPDHLPGKDQIAGMGTKIEVRKGTLITQAMLFEEEPTPADLRHREMKSVWLPSNLRKDDVVDIRVQFPTGQDYIILSKKKIDRLESPAFWTTLDEKEILLLSSAIVDAYLHEATLYALTYVEPELQDKAVPTYPPNEEVAKLIARDPNIVNKAEKHLEITLRSTLEEDLGKRRAGGQVHVSEYQASPTFGASAFGASTSGNASGSESYTSAPYTVEAPSSVSTSGTVLEPEMIMSSSARQDQSSEADQILGPSSSDKRLMEGEDTETANAELIFTQP